MTPSRRVTPDCPGRTCTTPGRSRCCRRCAPRWPHPRRRPASPTINVVLPVPGDVRGLAAGHTVRARCPGRRRSGDHHQPRRSRVPLSGWSPNSPTATRRADDEATAIPELCALSWTVYSLPGAPVVRAPRTRRRRIRAAVRGAIGRRRARHHRAGLRRLDIDDPRGTCRATAGIRPATPYSRPCAVARVAGAGERRARRRDHRGQRGAQPIARISRTASRPIAAGLEPMALSQRRKPRSPAMRCVRSPRWCGRRGWPRSDAILHSAWND